MNTIAISTAQWNQTAKVINPEDGKEITVFYIGRVVDEINTFAVSVPPHGRTMYFCSQHRCIFKIGRRCPDCMSTTTDTEPVSRVVTPPNSAEIPELGK